jgi:peptide/nickel transport system substrate-binding protein
VKFHNGDVLTAKDVKFTLDRAITEPLVEAAEARTAIQHVDLVDDYTLKIITKGTQPYLPWFFNSKPCKLGAVQPMDYTQKNGLNYFLVHPIGSGPFQFVRHISGDVVESRATNIHWQVKPAFRDLSMILVPEEATAVAMISSGQIDVAEVNLEDGTTLEKNGFKIGSLAQTVATVQFSSPLDRRNAGKPTNDIKVRQALALGINYDEIRNQFFLGKATPPLAVPMGPNMADIDAAHWKDYASTLFHYDPASAKQLLKDAGYPNGFNIKLYSFILTGGGWAHKLAEVIQGYWLNIGVKAELHPVDSGAFISLNIGGSNKAPTDELVGQPRIMANGVKVLAGTMLTSVFHSGQNYGVGGGTAELVYPGLDKLVEATLSEPDAVKRKDIIAQAIKQAADYYVAIPIAVVPNVFAIGSTVEMQIYPQMIFEGAVGYVPFMKHGK